MIIQMKDLMFTCLLLTLGSITFAYARNSFPITVPVILGFWTVPFALFATGSVRLRRKGEVL